MFTPNKNIFNEVEYELRLARKKFPKTTDAGMALVEEVGELAQALLQQKHEPEKGITDEDIYAEAIQVAAMAIRIATEGIPGFPYDPQAPCCI